MKDGKARYKFGKNLKPETGCLTGPRQKLCACGTMRRAKTLFNGLNKGNSFLYTDPGTGVSTFQNYIGAGAVRHLPARTAKEMSRPKRTSTAPKCSKCSRTFQSGWDYCPADGTSGPPLRPNE